MKTGNILDEMNFEVFESEVEKLLRDCDKGALVDALEDVGVPASLMLSHDECLEECRNTLSGANGNGTIMAVALALGIARRKK